ncbi:MAG: hypothetical protein U0797_26170 [Gemmataceae bacterium]
MPVVGPEVVTGSTRLALGTATKLVLNTLTTGAMVVRLGKTFGHLMVDLRATNVKLVGVHQPHRPPPPASTTPRRTTCPEVRR